MKSIFKILGILIGVVLLIAIGGFSYFNIIGIPTYDREVPEFTVDHTADRVKRGARLAGMVCVNCHAGPDGSMSGSKMLDLDPSFGVAYVPNITQHPDAKIAGYTDSDLAYLLRTGVKLNGSYAPPYMPKFPHLADEDLKDIIAYLRSDHWTVQPKNTVQPDSKPSFMTKLLCNVAFKPLPYPESVTPTPDSSDLIAWGRYMMHGRTECYTCHSADFKTMNIMEPEKSEGYMGGGNILYDPDGNKILSANITMDETGIGYWSEEEFIKALKWGKRPDGTLLSVAMPKFTVMTDFEAKAIYAYLKTVPKLENVVERAEN